MAEVYETGKAPVVRVDECKGDLVVTGWAEPIVRVRGDAIVEETEGVLIVRGDGDLRLNVPMEASLEIGSVHGDAALKGFNGPVSASQVRGDLAFTGVGSMKLGAIHGDMSAKGVAGLLSVEAIHGDAAIRNVTDLALGTVHGDCIVRGADGSVSLHEVMGDIQAAEVVGDLHLEVVHRDANFQDVGGVIHLGQARGDIRLIGPLGPGDHELTAEGDIVLRWPAGAPLNLRVQAGAVKNRLTLVDESREGNVLTGRVGEGKTNLTLHARGRVVLKETEMFDEKMEAFGAAQDGGFGSGTDFDDLAAQIKGQVEAQMNRFSQEMEARFGPELGQRIAEQVTRKTEKAAAKAERAAEKARRKAEGRAFGFTFSSPPGTPPPPPTRKADSTTEQLKILKMVENGTISPDEANMLLEALGS